MQTVTERMRLGLDFRLTYKYTLSLHHPLAGFTDTVFYVARTLFQYLPRRILPAMTNDLALRHLPHTGTLDRYTIQAKMR